MIHLSSSMLAKDLPLYSIDKMNFTKLKSICKGLFLFVVFVIVNHRKYVVSRGTYDAFVTNPRSWV